jgi:hypothetical protein
MSFGFNSGYLNSVINLGENHQCLRGGRASTHASDFKEPTGRVLTWSLWEPRTELSIQLTSLCDEKNTMRNHTIVIRGPVQIVGAR